jgi:hypothetical protein
MKRRLVCSVFLLVVLAVLPIARGPRPAAAQLPSADLAIVRLVGPRHLESGHVATFRVVAVNDGPATSQLDVALSGVGLEVNYLVCDRGISPDGPFCEYSNVAPGTQLTTLAVARAAPGAGETGTITACVGNEGQTEDPNSSNDCATLTVR